MAFPTTLDNFTNPTAGDPTTAPHHATQHGDANDAIEALEAKVGADSSAVTASHDYKLSGVTGADKAVSKTGTETLTNKTLTAPTIAAIRTGPSSLLTLPTVSDTLVGRADVVTLTNKTLVDSSTFFQDNANPGRAMQFQLSGITAGQTRTLTVPDASDTLVGLATTDTLTNKTLSTGSKINSLADENLSLYGLANQALYNTDFKAAQRGTTFTTPNDDTYGFDGWNFLEDGNGAWTFSRSSDVPTTGASFSMKCVNVTTNKQCGIVQFMDNVDAIDLIGRTVSISFDAKTTNAKVIGNLRATVLSWNSTADTITSDVVGTWAGNGTDPTWATNWTAEVAGANKALTTSWQTFTIENIAIDTASTANIAVVIWVDDTTITANDEFYVTKIKMNVGASVLPWQAVPHIDEIIKGQRRLYIPDCAQTTAHIGLGTAASTTVARIMIPLPVKMRAIPALTATAGDWQLTDTVTSIDLTAISVASSTFTTTNMVSLSCTVSAGLTQFRPYMLIADGTANRQLVLSAEL